MSSPVLWYATRASGLMALVLLSATVVLGILTTTRATSPRWPGVAVQDLHRRVSLATVVFVALHVLTSVLDTFVHIGWAAVVVPFASGYKRFWVGLGALSLDLVLAVVVTSLLRHRVPARTWRGVHWLVYAAWPVAVFHTLGIGTDMRLSWARALAVGCILAVAVAACWRGAHAARQRRHTGVLPTVQGRPDGVGLKHRAGLP